MMSYLVLCAAHLPTRVLMPLFFFYDAATRELYTLSLHDALPISGLLRGRGRPADTSAPPRARGARTSLRDRKSTRLNSSHLGISYAVFCLKKKKKTAPPS